MSKQEPSEVDNRFILRGRIYPAIRSCVNNRYKIILGFFVYYSFIFRSETFRDILSDTPVKWAASILFTLFVSLNSLSYLLNAKDQIDREGEGASLLGAVNIELIFFFVSIIMIWGAHHLIKT